MYDVLFYNYYFLNIKEPVVIQAINKEQARGGLRTFLAQQDNLEKYRGLPIIEETVSRPVTGISSRMVGNEKYLWVGFDQSPDGWIKEKDYEKSKLPAAVDRPQE